LVHISALADKFVSNPREVVKAGDVVKVKVVEVDAERKRISLSMRLTDSAKNHISEKPANASSRGNKQKQKPKAEPAGNNAFALAFAQAKVK
ncbi:MAG: S1 RNA-binding domain-containing protein, partial [Gammaproteobacteria bacterium]|nr:S1 RNA-binding domain-containing protein [Gammaproteobacteria bacterium]